MEQLTLVQAIVLGIVQGLTEFLPISSTAHLRIVPALAGWKDIGAEATAVMQLGTLLAVLIYFILRRATPLFTTVQTKLDKVNSVVQENVGGARVVKAFVREEYENGRFDKANAELRDTNWRVLMLLAVMSPVLNIVMNASVAAIILIGGLKAGVGGVSVGSIMASVTYVTQVLMSVMMVTMMFQSVSRSIASGKRVIEVLDTEPVIVSGSADRPSAEVQVSFRKVEFRYPGTAGSPVLRDINLDIRRGETLAVIGSTGTGKSTLINLIPRFYDATGGSILVNGLDVKDYDIKKLRKKIGFVMQKSELFSETIANNIRWGKPDADDTELKEAAETAQAAEFIGSFADGFGTLVAEKGASLSGGQKQRLSIARALVRKPDILILDDCTSALDLATEAKLQQALRRRLKNTTVIMIAQRIASVKNADAIAKVIMAKKMARTRREKSPINKASTNDKAKDETKPTPKAVQVAPMCVVASAMPYAPMPKNMVCAKLTMPV